MKQGIKKKIIIQTGSLRVGGQEKMLSELLKIIDPIKYEVLLLVEENCGKENIYEEKIPNYIKYEFLTSEKFMKKLNSLKQSRNPISKLIYSIMLKLKKKIAIKNFKKYLDFSNIIIDYNLGLLRHCNELNLVGKRLIGWSHAGLGGKLKDKRKEKNRRCYTDIVTINEEMRKCYEERLGKEGVKIHKIHNFLDENIILSNSQESLDEELGEYIISVGALTENKNNACLIRAFRELIDKGIKENLVIIGEGKERENLENLILELNLKDRVKLLGLKINPYKYIGKSSLFVQCSYSEGFPLVLLESMILGKAVVSTDNYGSREILDNGKYGMIVENNYKEVSKKIYKLLDNKNLKKQMEGLALLRSKEFSLKAGQKYMEDFLDSL